MDAFYGRKDVIDQLSSLWKKRGREVIDEMIDRVRKFPHKNDVSVRTALVYEGHLAPIVEADGYFDALVPFGNLLNI